MEINTSRRDWLTIGCFLLFLLAVTIFWEEGRELLRYALIPGDPDVTMEAVECFANDLVNGQPFTVAAETFCLRILSNG